MPDYESMMDKSMNGAGKGSGFSNFSSVSTMLKGFMELQKQQLEVDKAKAEAEKAKVDLAISNDDDYEYEDESEGVNAASQKMPAGTQQLVGPYKTRRTKRSLLSKLGKNSQVPLASGETDNKPKPFIGAGSFMTSKTSIPTSKKNLPINNAIPKMPALVKTPNPLKQLNSNLIMMKLLEMAEEGSTDLLKQSKKLMSLKTGVIDGSLPSWGKKNIKVDSSDQKLEGYDDDVYEMPASNVKYKGSYGKHKISPSTSPTIFVRDGQSPDSGNGQQDWTNSASKWMGSAGSSGWSGSSGGWPGSQASGGQKSRSFYKRQLKRRQGVQYTRDDQTFSTQGGMSSSPQAAQGVPGAAQGGAGSTPSGDSYWASPSAWFGGAPPPQGGTQGSAAAPSWGASPTMQTSGASPQGWGSQSSPPSGSPTPGDSMMGQASIPSNSWSGQPPPPPPPAPTPWSNQGGTGGTGGSAGSQGSNQRNVKRSLDDFNPSHGSVTLSNIPFNGGMMQPGLGSGVLGPGSGSEMTIKNENIPNLSFSMNPPTPSPMGVDYDDSSSFPTYQAMEVEDASPPRILDPNYLLVAPSLRPLSQPMPSTINLLPPQPIEIAPQPHLAYLKDGYLAAPNVAKAPLKPQYTMFPQPGQILMAPDNGYSLLSPTYMNLKKRLKERKILSDDKSDDLVSGDLSPIVIYALKKKVGKPQETVVKKIVLDPKNGIIVTQSNDDDLSMPKFPPKTERIIRRKREETTTEESSTTESSTADDNDKQDTTSIKPTEASTDSSTSVESISEGGIKQDPNGHKHGKFNTAPTSDEMQQMMMNIPYADMFVTKNDEDGEDSEDFDFVGESLRNLRFRRSEKPSYQYQADSEGSDYDYDRVEGNNSKQTRRVQIGFKQFTDGLPDGTVEKISAGGGRAPGHHEGGGLTVQVRQGGQTEDEVEEYEDENEEPSDDQTEGDNDNDNEDVYNETDDQLSQESGARKRSELVFVKKPTKLRRGRGKKTLNFFFTW